MASASMIAWVGLFGFLSCVVDGSVSLRRAVGSRVGPMHLHKPAHTNTFLRSQSRPLTRRSAEVMTNVEGESESSSWVGGAGVSGLTSGVNTVFDINRISEILPHRYPFLLVDKVIEYEAGKRAVGVKSITLNEPQFTGHFPGNPIMPGVMQIEALAQLAGIVCLQMEGSTPGAVFFFAGIDGVKWKKPVIPGDQLVMEVEIKSWKPRFGIAKASGKGYVDGKLAVDVKEMTFALAK
ncbi:hypothetical protein AAMO2058_001537500 [Amorphochlora amoebiformis]